MCRCEFRLVDCAQWIRPVDCFKHVVRTRRLCRHDFLSYSTNLVVETDSRHRTEAKEVIYARIIIGRPKRRWLTGWIPWRRF